LPMDCPSVTQILSATKPIESVKALERWKLRVGEKEAERISQDALARGIALDEKIQQYFKTAEPGDEKIDQYLSKFSRILNFEENIESVKYKYHGRYDCLAEINSIVYIIDWKGAKKTTLAKWLYDYPLQLSAYYNALEEEGAYIDGGMIVMFIGNKDEPIKQIQEFFFNRNVLEQCFQKFVKRRLQYDNLKTVKN